MFQDFGDLFDLETWICSLGGFLLLSLLCKRPFWNYLCDLGFSSKSKGGHKEER